MRHVFPLFAGDVVAMRGSSPIHARGPSTQAEALKASDEVRFLRLPPRLYLVSAITFLPPELHLLAMHIVHAYACMCICMYIHEQAISSRTTHPASESS